MDERIEDRIIQKARYVSEALSVLAEKRDTLSFDEYRAAREQRDVVEREFETAIEACIDIGQLLLKANAIPVPETNAQVFRDLEQSGMIDSQTAHQMARAAGFRNILSHKYGTQINDQDVFTFLQNDLPLFQRFLEEVRDEIA